MTESRDKENKMIYRGQAPKEKAERLLSVVWPGMEQERWTIGSYAILGLSTHWDGAERRSRLCIRPDECALCARRVPACWTGYVTALRRGRRTWCILALPSSAALGIAQALSGDCLRGATIELRRERLNGPVIVTRVETPLVTFREQEPCMIPTLCRIYGEEYREHLSSIAGGTGI